MSRLEPMVEKLTENVAAIAKTLATVAKDVTVLKTDVSTLKTDVKRMDGQVDLLAAKFVNMETYMHEELATKMELHDAEIRLTGHIEGLAAQQKTFDLELTAQRSRIDRLEGSPA